MSRERILQAAAELFSQKGYAGAGVDELARRSKIAKTAIYYHFTNKEGLLAAVLERIATEWIERIERIAFEGVEPLERLDRALAGMRALIEERPWILRLFQIMALEVAERKPEVKAALQAIGLRARRAIVAGLQDTLHMEVPRADGVARVVLSLLNAITLAQQIDPALSLEEAFSEIRRLVILLVASEIDPDLIAGLERGVLELRAAAPLPPPIAHG